MQTIERLGEKITRLYQVGKVSEALAAAQQALIDYPDNLTLLSNAGAFSLMLSDLTLAESYFIKTLQLDPNNISAHNNIANLYVKQQRLCDAEKHYKMALKINFSFTDAYNNLASLLVEQKRFEEAESLYRQALRTNPNNVGMYDKLAHVYIAQQRFDDAEKCYCDALKINSIDTQIHHNFAKLLIQLERVNEAEQHVDKALEINSGSTDAYKRLAESYKKQQRFAEAEKCYKKALGIDDNDSRTYEKLARLMQEQERFYESEAYYRKALSITPQSERIHNNLGNVFYNQEMMDEAQEHYQKALAINPHFFEAQSNYATLLMHKKNYKDAEQYFQQSLDNNPNHANAHRNFALLLVHQKQYKKAIHHYQTALKINSGCYDSRFNFALLQLALSDFEQGWQNYESRHHPARKDKNTVPPVITASHYQGEDLTGKNLLVYPEQGFGDEIQFIRYLPLLKSQKRVKKLVLACKPALKSLFSGMSCIDHVLSTDEFANAKLQGIDYWVFIMSLPLHFNTVLESIPNQLPYLTVSVSKQDQWQSRLPAKTTTDFRIGLVWKGRKAHKNDADRSLPSLQTLQPLWAVKEALQGSVNLHFISLQKGEGEDEATNPFVGQDILHLGSDIQDFSDSAAIVSQLDLLICVDTAIAHLAGSLNIPCWVLLPYYGTDWRWLEVRNDSPWYPEVMTLYRQTKEQGWSNVIQQVVNDLTNSLRNA